MAGASVRRPIPAVVFILLLSLLSAIVWYRVLNRSPASTPTTKPSATTHACAPKPATTTGAKTKAGAKAPVKAKAIVWPKATAVHVSVLNGSERAGLAKSVATQLKSRGFVIGAITNDTVQNLVVTQVRYGARAATAAKLVQLYLPGSRLVPNAGTTTTVTVSLGSAYKTLATNAAVAKATKTTTAVPC
jgi:hypothetical protein